MKRNRMLPWLAVAALFAIAAWLFSFSDTPASIPEHVVSFPRAPAVDPPRDTARTRPAKAVAGPPKSEPTRKRDPLLVALTAGTNGSAVVLEANALRNSPIGELFVDCLRSSDAGVLERVRDQLGMDPLQDLDRLAFSQEGTVMTGQFAGVHWDNIFGGTTPSRYGDQANLYDVTEDGGDAWAATRWGDQLFAVGPQASARAMVDRLEGRAADEPPLISEEQAYGDAYGVVGAPALGAVLEQLLPDEAALRDRLAAGASSIEFHLDASSDLALTADVRGSDPAALSDLAHSLGAALTVWRVYAQGNAQPELAALLDQADVEPRDGYFELHLALPFTVLQARLANCRDWKWNSPPASK